MFTLRALSRIRKRSHARRIRGMMEVLEARQLMAGDLIMGSNAISADSPDGDSPPAIVQSPQEATVKETAVSPIVDTLDPGRVDAAFSGEQPLLPQDFLPCCPAVPLDNGFANSTSIESGDVEFNLIETTEPVEPPEAIESLAGPYGSRDRAAAGLKSTNDYRLIYPFSAAGIQLGNLLTDSLASEASTHFSRLGEGSRYFTADGSRPSMDGPSLANQSLTPYVQSDTFMAMGLLPSPLTADQPDDPTFAIQTDSHSYQARSAHFDAWVEGQDLNSLREDALAIDADEYVDPLPFLSVGTNPISAAVSHFVGIDFYGVESDSSDKEEASLITKLNKNRFQFAAFAFVFTMVTVRMNSADSKRKKSDTSRN